MVFSKLATALTVIFFVSIVALICELLYVLWRHRSFRRHSSPPPPTHIGDQNPDNFPTADAATKELLLYFFCLKPHIPEDSSGRPNKNTDASSPNDEVIDVFKLFEANGPSRFLCTIKEEDKEDVESTSDVDFANRSTTKSSCLQTGVQLAREPVAVEEEEEEVAVTVDGDDGSMKTEFSTTCDSPLFFTPEGSPSREVIDLEFVISVHATGNVDER
ncbi:hypothetical protein Lser_V15G06429 [Lactuca serriola]